MDAQQRKRLFDMEIDEISLVDRGANQHAAIVFSKALDPEEDDVSIGYQDEVELYDADGDLVESLEEGDVVFDEDGNEYIYTEDPDQYDYDDDGYIGKAINPLNSVKGFWRGARVGAKNAKAPFLTNQEAMNVASEAGSRSGRAGLRAGVAAGRYWKPAAAVAGGGALVSGGGLYALKRRNNGVQKSLGDVVMEELSKASTEDERSEIIAKAMEEVEVAKSQAAEAWERVAAQDDAMLENAFISKAAEYNLPVDPTDFGLILKAASTVLDYDQLELLDQLFNGVGEALYEEIGYVGDTDNASVLDVVNGYVGELVGKSDYSTEELSTAVFEANPEAYDEYLAENRW